MRWFMGGRGPRACVGVQVRPPGELPVSWGRPLQGQLPAGGPVYRHSWRGYRRDNSGRIFG